MTAMICPNCSTDFNGNYCNECGQKSTDIKYTMKGMLYDFFFSTFHIEKKGLPYTIRELTLRPGEAIQKVIHGQRLYLYPAFKYLILMGALVVIFSLRYKFFHNEASTFSESKTLPVWLGLDMAEEAFFESFFKFAEDEATLLNIMAVPVFTLFSWLLLSRGRYNFAENLILNTYITGHQLLFLLGLVPLFEFFPQSKPMLIAIYTAAIMAYNAWAYIQFFSSEGKNTSTVVLSLVAVMFSYIYQLPLNVLVFYVYEHFIHPYIHWVPSITP
jgi:Protein of unknown function (DUF3667)